MMLEVRSLTKRFGGVVAVDSVNFSVDSGEIMGTDRAQWRRQDNPVQRGRRGARA